MSLVRLLTTGKSLVGLTEGGNRYRVSRHRLLPRFEPKNSRVTGAMIASGAEAAAVCSPKVEAASVAVATTDLEHASIRAGKPAGRLAQLWNWCALQLTRIRFWRPGLAAKSGIPRFAKSMVQAELSLENVKV